MGGGVGGGVGGVRWWCGWWLRPIFSFSPDLSKQYNDS